MNWDLLLDEMGFENRLLMLDMCTYCKFATKSYSLVDFLFAHESQNQLKTNWGFTIENSCTVFLFKSISLCVGCDIPSTPNCAEAVFVCQSSVSWVHCWDAVFALRSSVFLAPISIRDRRAMKLRTGKACRGCTLAPSCRRLDSHTRTSEKVSMRYVDENCFRLQLV